MENAIHQPPAWFLYLIVCENGAYYCGITNHLERRWQQHVKGKGAKYTRANRPVAMKVLQDGLSRSEALQREYQVKQLSKAAKHRLWVEAVLCFSN